jgi:hypothetical protein
VSGSEVSTTSTTEVRLRSGNIASALSSGTAYQVRIKSSSASGTATLSAARLVIIQNGTIVKTETLITLGSNSTTTSVSYVDWTNGKIYLWDADHWDGTLAVYFEAFLSGSGAGVTAYAQLAAVGGSAVSGSEVSQGGTTDARVRSGAISLTDGVEYKVQFKTSSATARVRGARLVIVQTGSPTKTESYIPLNTAARAVSTETALKALFRWDDEDWSVGSYNVYLESTLAAPSAQTAYEDANDGTNDDATVSSTNTSKTRQRSGGWNPDDDTNYDSQLRTSSGTGTFYGSDLIVQANLPSGVTVTPDAAAASGGLAAPAVVLGSVTIAAALAEAIGLLIDPTAVLGSVAAAAGAASALGRVIDPTVGISGGGETVTPAAASALGQAIEPTSVLGSLGITAEAAAAIGRTVDPTAVLGSIAAANMVAAALGGVSAPAIILGSLGITAEDAAAVGEVVAPGVTLGSLIVAPDAAGAFGVSIAPAAILGSMVLTPWAAAVAVVIDPSTLVSVVVILAHGVVYGPIFSGAVAGGGGTQVVMGPEYAGEGVGTGAGYVSGPDDEGVLE